LPGTITSINVKVGDDVKAGDTLLVLEAMKMANNIEAEKDGKVTAICVKAGQSVMEDDALVVIE
jgi:glutaconyl-CoA/methylmalonyl-CoA decarboxylase subunit gamma